MTSFFNRGSIIFVLILLVMPLLFGCGSQLPKAQFIKVSGIVEMKQKEAEKFVQVKEKDVLLAGGGVRTLKEATADLIIANRGVLEIRPDSYFELPSSDVDIQQNSGSIIYRINENKNGYKINTPQGLTCVLGTVLLLTVNTDSTIVGVKEGRVSLTNKNGDIRFIEANERLTVNSNGSFSEKTAFDLTTDGFSYQKEDGKWLPVDKTK